MTLAARQGLIRLARLHTRGFSNQLHHRVEFGIDFGDARDVVADQFFGGDSLLADGFSLRGRGSENDLHC
jgi:hypothetical protein